MLMARSINPSAPTLFKAKLSPHSKSRRKKVGSIKSGQETVRIGPSSSHERFDTVPKKLEWELTPELRMGIRFAETLISDLICQNDCQVLEFKGYGKNFITRYGYSPDAFVQMAFQAAYYGLYGEFIVILLLGNVPVLIVSRSIRTNRVHIRTGYDQDLLPWKDRSHSICYRRICRFREDFLGREPCGCKDRCSSKSMPEAHREHQNMRESPRPRPTSVCTLLHLATSNRRRRSGNGKQ